MYYLSHCNSAIKGYRAFDSVIKLALKIKESKPFRFIGYVYGCLKNLKPQQKADLVIKLAEEGKNTLYIAAKMGTLLT